VFGDDDEVGTLRLTSPERVVAAARLVTTGRVFPLDAPWGTFDPPLTPARTSPRHTVLHRDGAFSYDDVWDNVHPQGSSQWDSLAHIGYTPEAFYNGATAAEVASGERNSIAAWGATGIAGRGVLFDVPRSFAAAGRSWDPVSSTELTVDDLELARTTAGITLSEGDILVLHTGFAEHHAGRTRAERWASDRPGRAPGLAHDESICEYLWDNGVAAVVSDTYAVEAWPADLAPDAEPVRFLHRLLIAQLGMALGELWWTAELAADCAADGRHEFLVTSAPWNVRGGIGSPANALALK
jgi:kynurenine formamidase